MTNRRSFFKGLGAGFTSLFLGRDKSGQAGPEIGEQRSEQGKPEAGESRADCPIGGHLRFDKEFDLVVVGGGIAGTTAAIAAARNGMKVALVHNRSMLGGNSSSEVRLFPENNPGHQPWIKESGIHDEFHTEERVRNHREYREGLMNCHWDLVLYEKVILEENITLILNAHVFRVEKGGDSRIRAVEAIQIGTERILRLEAPLFLDATGDGFLGHLAEADYRWGREARSEYDEPLAPERADEKVMGNTLFFAASDAGRPVPFKRPDWAAEFNSDDELTGRNHTRFHTGYWWIEVGAPYHPIHDNNKIRHEALRQLLGVWDHIKNKEDHGAENYGLEFVGFWPYKRECRRILGDYVLTQHHIQDPKELGDSIAYGCWGVDIHVQGGILAQDTPPYPSPHTDENWESLGSLVYGVPLRSLYSRNVENLMMAGRPISGSYVAFSSSRVLSTGCIVGQAAGTAAAFCKKHNALPKEVSKNHAKELQQTILKQDGHIPGVENEDPDDLARQAKVTGSSQAQLIFPSPNRSRELSMPHAQLFPVSENRIERIELFMRSDLASDAEMRLGLRAAPEVWDFRSTEDLAEARAVVPARSEGWVAFPFNADVQPERLYWVYTQTQPGVFWKAFYQEEEQSLRVPAGATPANLPGNRRWRTINQGNCLCTRVFPQSHPFSPRNVIKGTHRPDRWTNIWVSDPNEGLPAWLELAWTRPQTFNKVLLTFDTNTLRRETAPLFRYPDCVKDYSIEAGVNGGWKTVAEATDNYSRRCEHDFDPIRADRLRLNVASTNGAPSARVFEIRVYHETKL